VDSRFAPREALRAAGATRERSLVGPLVLLALLGGSPLRAQSPGLSAVTGSVRDASTHEPVLDVKVIATSPRFQTDTRAITHSTGVYRLRELPSGTYTLQFDRDGYKPLTREGVTLNHDEVLRLDVELVPAPSAPLVKATPQRVAAWMGAVAGTIVDALTRQPLSEVAVTVTSPEIQGGSTVISQATGAYQTTDLLPGTYSLGFERGAYRPTSLKTVTVTAGQVSRVNIQLVPASPKQANGVGSVDVVATQAPVDAPRPFAQTLPVSPAGADNGGLRSIFGLASIPEATTVQPPGLGTVAGTVIDAATHARLQGVLVTATSAQLHVEGAVLTQATGDYKFRQLPPGAYTFRFDKATYKPVVRDGMAIGGEQTLLLDVQLVVDELGPPEASGAR
jgi:hypothetical protein